MKFLIIASAFTTALAVLTEPQQQFLFSTFARQYDKQYEATDVPKKFEAFKSNLDVILTHNSNPHRTFTMAVNPLADLTAAEYRSRLTLRIPDEPSSVPVHRAPAPAADDLEIDWRDKHIIGAVKDQMACGSCFAFSAIGALEPLVARATGSVTTLSEQQLVSCSWEQGNLGCSGGLMNYCYDHIKLVGAMREADYPYTGTNSDCAETEQAAAVRLKDYSAVAPTAEALEAAVLQQPVAIALSASSAAFQFYSSGVVRAEDCTANVNHGVTLVGAGTENGIYYYTIRNSWSAAWGAKGYIKIERRTNACGMEAHNWNMVPGEVEVV